MIARLRFGLVVAMFAGGTLAAAVAGCSSSSARATFASPTDPGFGEDGGTTPPFGGGDADAPCQGLACARPACTNGKTTTLHGVVFDPAARNPLYNVAVYIPTDGNATLPPLTQGATCDRCGSRVLNPVASATTDTKGEFVLQNVPVGDALPLVIQVGKWRRVVKVDIKAPCEDNEAKYGTLTLPKNGAEGDMPHIAVTSGEADALECLLRGMGVDEREFVAGDNPRGHIHMFAGHGGVGVTGSPDASTLWNDAAKLKAYDIVALSCEGEEYNDTKTNKQALVDYANAGGRVFSTHFHYTWFKNSPDAQFQKVATWGGTTLGNQDGEHDIDMSFPKGDALAHWMLNTGGSTKLGKIALRNVRTSLTQVTSGVSQAWVRKPSGPVRYFSFNTPIGATEDATCGRVVFSDLHVVDNGGNAFPVGCPEAGGLKAQQQALEFMLFDLSSCVQDDSTPPTAPK